MRFKEFLMSEEGVGPRHLSAAKMSLDEMVEWVQNNASSFMNTGNPIYRGVDSHEAEGLYNGAQMNRKAANTYNYGNLWMSNYHDWAKYPPRTKSFICSTDEDYTESYGTTYMVIPSDSSMIGICPAEDLWDSFPDIMEITDHFGMSGFIGMIDYIVNLKTNGEGRQVQQDWDRFAGILNSIDAEDVKKIADDTDYYQNNYAQRLLKYMRKNQLETMYEVFERIFDPKRAGFSLIKADGFHGPEQSEVWMSGSVLLVYPHTWRRIKEALDLDF